MHASVINILIGDYDITTFCIKNQYVFLHFAVLEALQCGDTVMKCSDLHKSVEQLRKIDNQSENNISGFDKQFQVNKFIVYISLCFYGMFLFLF